MVNNLNEKVTMGQGEYVVFHQLPDNGKKEVARETYDKAYKVLLEYAPAAIINNGADKKAAEEKCAHRYELIREKVKKIDPSLEVAFIPKALYELFFIRKSIKEDLKQKHICLLVNPSCHADPKANPDLNQICSKKIEEMKLKGKCWHLCHFDDAGNNEDECVKELAYRLNRTIVKNLLPTSEGFTKQELAQFTENKIEFLKNHHKNGSEIAEKRNRGEQAASIASCVTPGPTTNFGFESTRGSIMPMGIRDDADAEIIRKAMALECSQEAQRSFVLYRGSDFQDDSVTALSNDSTAYSLSYGTGLFAGCVYDGGATSFYYMRKKKDAYAILVPYDQMNQSPFYIPPTNTLCQLFGDGESFHGRTKAWKLFNMAQIAGINCGRGTDPRPLVQSDLSKSEITQQFQEYKKKAIQLK